MAKKGRLSKLSWLKRALVGAIQWICRLFPIQRNKIVFANFIGKGMGGSPKYIAEELLREGLDYDLVWLTEDRNATFTEGIRPVKMYSLRGRYELATAAVIVNNVKHKLPFYKRSRQYYIQTWHGDFALKFIEKEVEDKLNPGYVAESKADSRETDLILSGSRQFSNIVRQSFWYDGEIFECGVPCNDPFFTSSEGSRKAIQSKFGIPDGTHIALYAPTFRDGEDKDFELPDFEAVVSRLRTLDGHPWVLLVRFHPLDQGQLAKVTFSDHVLNGSKYPDPQDITKASDLLITDYSSIMYDFALQRKPVVLFAPDVDHYQATRGLRQIFWEVPFPLAQAKEALPAALAQAFDPSFSSRLEVFLKERVCSYDDGHASERVAARIKEVISLGEKQP